MPRESLIQIYRSTTASNAPSLTAGELAINIPDKKLFVGGTSGNITFLDASAHVTTVNGLTSAITITGSGAITQTVSGTTTTFGARLASATVTGVASFGNEFVVTSGAVGLTSNYVKSVNGLTGAVVSIATTGSNTFTGLNTFNAGVSASALTVAGGATFSSNVYLGDAATGVTAESNDFVRILAGTAYGYGNGVAGIYQSRKNLSASTSGVICATPEIYGAKYTTVELMVEYAEILAFYGGAAWASHKFVINVSSDEEYGGILTLSHTESITKTGSIATVPFIVDSSDSGLRIEVTATVPANSSKSYSGWRFKTTMRVY